MPYLITFVSPKSMPPRLIISTEYPSGSNANANKESIKESIKQTHQSK